MSDPCLPDRVWWTAEQIAAAELVDMPSTPRRINALAARFNWRAVPGKARRRKGKGGGWEYHYTLFPMRAQQALLAAVKDPKVPEVLSRGEAWEWFGSLPDLARETAERRLLVIQKTEALERGGLGRDLAVREIAQIEMISARTIWNWLGLIEGVRADDRLPYLAPRHRIAKRRVAQAECSEEFWEVVKSDYLRPERPSFSSCYRRAVRIAKEHGWQTASERTLRNRLHREVPQLTITLCRKGVDALKALFPSQTRDRMSLHAMEAVNADYHRLDVFVRWPAEPGSNSSEGEIVRPQLVAFQDLHSGRILSWRLDKTPNKVGVSLALGDMIERFGIPDHVVLDNGREFANKFLTGGVKTRFRFKVKDDDIPGVLTTLGVEIHWATPYSGQSKPIERAFKDLADDIAKDPRFEGAYTGNGVDAKPENYGNAAIPLEDFIRVVAEGIEEHNARPGRRGQTTAGRSIIETFEESYANAPIRKATPEQRRLWLMGAEGVKADSRNGLIRFMGNEYHAEWMYEIAGDRVVARFDPADLRAPLHIYALGGGYLGEAECRVAAGFFDLDEARQHNAARKKWVKAEKEAAAAARKYRARELGGYLDGIGAREPAPAPETKVVRMTPQKRLPKSTPKPAPLSKAETAQRAAFVADFQARKSTKDEAAAKRDDARERFARAEEIEARLADGEEVSRDLIRWMEGYRQTPEYRVFKREKETPARDVRQD
ncbi:MULTISPECIES: transposase domain-containing protein [Marinovum]|uniref:transposase domain-containing protein n=1 Tax=Marinovum TaxID=367771 RepID=UPI00065B0E4F|nr:transposase domain-containing protein [Marinovum sp. PR37]AKO97642.1 Mu transposase, Mu DNA binding protein, I gamma subdomain/Bacteriophage Mu transposase [Marinovum algicola DG 898]MDD9744302.1 transposase domain-containing protein [Marinovum sp. PR37]